MTSRAGSLFQLGVLDGMLSVLVRSGGLTVIDAAGRQARYGPDDGGRDVVMRMHDPWLPLKLAFDPMLVAGEAFMDGTLTIEQGDVRDFLLLVSEGLADVHRQRSAGWLGLLRRARDGMMPHNDRRRARRNVEQHYDLPLALYELFLDIDRHYSCAYFATGRESLEQAQRAKVRHLMAKLMLEPDCHVLDIGCGWGALATTIAQESGAFVKGLTLSAAQLEKARARAQALQLADRVEFALCDYRDEDGRHDRIVSVGMLEHVGRAGFDEYFARIARLLTDDGVAVVHSIGSSKVPDDPGGAKFRWLDRYIFPGGYIPSLSEIVAAAERTGLWITDIEILRQHYADTLKCWWDRFALHRAEAAQMMGERFCRMWEFYLSSSEAGFRNGNMIVFQMQLARRRERMPRTRDYMLDDERRAAASAMPRRASAA